VTNIVTIIVTKWES